LTYTAVIFMLVLAVALGLFLYFLLQRIRYLLLGRPEPRVDHVGRRTGGFLALVFGQRRVLREPMGVVHFFIFWGFIVIAVGTLQIIGEGLSAGFSLPLLGENRWFYLLKDILSLLVLIGVMIAAYVRFVVRPARLKANLESAVILALIFALVLTEFLYSGLSNALDPRAGRSLAFMTMAVSGLVDGAGAGGIELARDALWWLHVVLLLSFLVYIPKSKHLHLIACPFNEWLRNLKPRGAQIALVDFEDEEVEEYGVNRVEAFTRKQLLDLYACAECGRCQDNCPAYQSGKSLSPKLLINKLRDHLVEEGPSLVRGEAASPDAEVSGNGHKGPRMIGEVIAENEIWACTTCYSCQEQCPVQNEHINKIVDMRRHLVLMEGRFPHEASVVFRNMEVNGNPLGESALVRGDHLRRLGVPTIAENPEPEVLYWPGCSGALDPRNRKVSTAFVRLADAAGVSLATLGNEEKCCGDAARRLGNEFLFQTLAANNIETLRGHGVTKIVTQCPHCLNALKHEYRQMGGDFEVLHHTEFLHGLVATGRLRLRSSGDETVTYHDPCYLGRYNGIYDPPRDLLAAVGFELAEMPRRKAKAFCCGGGGGRMWLEEIEGERIGNVRADEILGVSPDIAVVACPYCLTMLKDGIDSRRAGETVRVMDIAEVLQALVPDAPVAADVLTSAEV
jgi:Fe-S oxidoreductase